MTKDFHYVYQECDCVINTICIADEKGEDCRAYDKAKELAGACETCKKTYQVTVATK